jgi:hypothetical protein
MLINIRKNAIYFTFTIFAAAMTVITFKIPEGIPFRDPIDLSIVLILMEIPLILAFYFLEAHYRYYLLKIVQTAVEYENELNLGVKVEDCKYLRYKKDCNKFASISKCLKCLHDNGMESHIRSANFNIYVYLLGAGFVTLNFLITVKIGLSLGEILGFFSVTILLTIGILYFYTSQSTKKYEGDNEFNNNSWNYFIPIIAFMVLTYLFYYLLLNSDINIRFTIIKNNFSYFTLSYLVALITSYVSFFLYPFIEKYQKAFHFQGKL